MPRLRRSDWREPGFIRRRHGRGHLVLDAMGKRIVDDEVLQRISELAIPPAWTDVWICADEHGHLQAVGIDDAGRRQYLYHERWRKQRDAEKHRVAQQLGRTLPRLRASCRRELKASGLSKERVMATAVRLLDLGLFRIGSERYAEENESFGLATLQRSHVFVTTKGVSFEYPAKSGQTSSFAITEPRVCSAVRDLLKRKDPSPELLGWWDAKLRVWCDLKSSHVNDYLRATVGEGTSAKDFRTWHGSVLMAMHLSDLARDGTTLTNRRLKDMYKSVAEELGNTATVARNSYVNPRVVDLANQGLVIKQVRRQAHELVPISASNALLDLLEADLT
ncbi:MAG: DNA topoisomerase IB [Actinomycetes bacterium]